MWLVASQGGLFISAVGGGSDPGGRFGERAVSLGSNPIEMIWRSNHLASCGGWGFVAHPEIGGSTIIAPGGVGDT